MEADPELYAAVEAAAAGQAAGAAAPAAAAPAAAGAERPLGAPPGLATPPGLALPDGGKAGAAANGAGLPGPAAAPPPPASEVTPQKAPRPEGNAAGFPLNLPSTPSNPNMLFSTINAETLEHAAQNVDFPVPEEKVGGVQGRVGCGRVGGGGVVCVGVDGCCVGTYGGGWGGVSMAGCGAGSARQPPPARWHWLPALLLHLQRMLRRRTLPPNQPVCLGGLGPLRAAAPPAHPSITYTTTPQPAPGRTWRPSPLRAVPWLTHQPPSHTQTTRHTHHPPPTVTTPPHPPAPTPSRPTPSTGHRPGGVHREQHHDPERGHQAARAVGLGQAGVPPLVCQLPGGEARGAGGCGRRAGVSLVVLCVWEVGCCGVACVVGCNLLHMQARFVALHRQPAKAQDDGRLAPHPAGVLPTSRPQRCPPLNVWAAYRRAGRPV